MKRIPISLAVAVLLLCGACTEDLGIGTVAEGDPTVPVRLYNEIVQEATTRVNDNGFCDGDAVGVYVVNYVDGQPGTMMPSGNQADNVKYVFDEETGNWTANLDVFFRDRHTHVDVVGYYPYAAPESVSAYPFEVAKDQSTAAANGLPGGYETSDFLWAKATDIVPTEQRIALQFHHAMAGITVTLSEGTGFAEGEFAALKKDVLVSNTVRKAEIDLSTGRVTPVGEVPETGIVPVRHEDGFRSVVVPQTVGEGLPLFHLTVDGTPYVFRKAEAFAYTAGKLHKFTIEISKKSAGGLEFKLLGESITAWETDNVSHDATAREYIVVDCPEPGTLKDCITAAGKDYTKVKNLKVTGSIDARDFYMMRDEMSVLQSLNLKEVTIAEYKDEWGDISGANQIPINAFYGKYTLVRFVLPDNITRIKACAFSGTNISGSLTIPNGVTDIEGEAFYECSSLTGTLKLPKNLKFIGVAAFTGCSFIGNLDIPALVTEIGDNAFEGCSGFTGNLTLPDGLEQLGRGAFSECSGFTGSLTIPHKIKKIEPYVFSRCGGLNGTLTLHDDIVEIREIAFAHCQFRGPLELPENLLIIGENAFVYNQFSGALKLPETLSVIKEGAFSGNGCLTGVVEIPEEIISIAPYAFAGCTQLEGVVLSKNTESIREGAFANCFQLNTITCHAQTPPYIDASAFDGVAKDNFTVEVPEASVAEYATAPVWMEFKRFSAYRDFSISRNRFRALNAELAKTFVLRAPSGEACSVESKPEWMDVAPMNGVGKMEVTVTFHEMARGAGNREGEVVFLLDGKDYRSRTVVEQYDYEYGDGDVVTAQSATQGAGVDLVFMGDCFDAKDIAEGKYLSGVNEAIGYFFDIEPYNTYRDYFNVYVVFGLSPDSGMGTVNTIREAKFGSSYTLNAGIQPDEATCFEYACKAPTVTEENIHRTLITLVENTEEYGGICYLWNDGSAIAVCPMSRDVYPYDFRGLVQHEAGGHGFAKLGDEYIYHNAFAQDCPAPNCGSTPAEEVRAAKQKGWCRNLSLTGNMHEVDWAHFIFDPNYADKVDIYEGGYMHTRGVFRSESNSCMNNNIPYYSAIQRETMVQNIKKYAGEEYSFEEFKQHDVLTPSMENVGMRSGSSLIKFAPSNKQHTPVFMGERPKLKGKH